MIRWRRRIIILRYIGTNFFSNMMRGIRITDWQVPCPESSSDVPAWLWPGGLALAFQDWSQAKLESNICSSACTKCQVMPLWGCKCEYSGWTLWKSTSGSILGWQWDNCQVRFMVLRQGGLPGGTDYFYWPPELLFFSPQMQGECTEGYSISSGCLCCIIYLLRLML